ncbi:caspase, EACC1-associated type [Nocardia brasiliensis]|uniref:caspase, EACC1-associated type n=1 Tax=Nocardia brasiliensis TaxID=37326 RepID=UPI0024540C4E|nr:AAA family ATPase [Nocardia brasiliensis]
MTDLRGAGSRAVLIGTGRTPSPSLPDVPAVATSLRDLRQTLLDRCEMPAANIGVVLDPADPATLDTSVRAAAAAATDVLLIYFVGHGLKPGNELYLATGATVDLNENRPASQALEFSAIPAAVARSRASTVLVVLDCCYSGKARLGPAVANGLLLVSATQWEPALFRTGEPHTVFTGALLRTLAAGDPHGPPLTTLGRMTELLDRELAQDKSGPCRPGIEFRGNASRLVIAKNHAYTRPAPDEPAVATATSDVNPYRGLTAYEKADSTRFFGREATVAALARAIAARASDFVVLTGPSGVGKSSVLGAGLLPLLTQGHVLAGSENWRQVTLTPGTDPLDALRTEIAKALQVSPESIGNLFADSTQLSERCTAAPMALVVDQFEDLFAHHPNIAAEYIATLSMLAAAARLTVICVRSDFLGRCLDYPVLEPAARAAVVVASMSTEELRSVIVEPAEQAGLAVAPDLVEVILSDALPRSSRTVEVLPLLSHALASTWTERIGRTLTVAAYLRAGRIDEAVTKTADAVYRSLDAAGKEEARQLFLALLPVDGEGQSTSRVVRRDSLELDARGNAVLDAFVRARLIGVGHGTVFLTHDALLGAWQQLREWIAQYGAALGEWQRLRSRAAEWRVHRLPGLLLSGTALQTALLLRTKRLRLHPDEENYLRASEDRQRRTLRLQFATAMSVLLLTVFAVAGGILAWDNSNKATVSANDAAVQQLQLLGKSYADTNPRAALSFLLTAAQRAPTGENRAALARALINSPFGGSVTMPDLREGYDAIVAVALSPDGSLLAAADETGHVALWRIEGRQLSSTVIGQFDIAQVHDLRFDATGRKLVVFGSDTDRSRPIDDRYRNVLWWDVGDPAHPVLEHADGAGAVALVSADGTVGVRRTLVGQRTETSLVRIGAQITEVARPDIPGSLLGFSGDNSLLVTADDSGYFLWDTADLAHPVQLARFSSALAVDTDPAQYSMITGGPRQFASFSPDNRLVALTGRGAPATLIDVTDRARPRALSTLSDTAQISLLGPSATRAEFSPSGRTLTIGGSGAGVQLWDVRDPSHPHVSRSLDTELARQIRALSYAAGGRSLVTGGLGGVVTLWNVESGTGITLEQEFEALGNDGYLSPDGMTLIVDGGPVSLEDPGTLAVWRLVDPDRPALVARIPQHPQYTADVSLSHDGDLAAVRNGDGSTSLWSLTDPAHPTQVGTVATNSSIGMTFPNTHTMHVRMDHAGKTIAVERDNGWQYIVQLWDISDPARPQPFADLPVRSGNQPTFTVSPNGRLLVTTNRSAGTEIWDISRRDRPRLRAELPGGASRLVSSADGRVLLRTGEIGEDQGTELYDLSDPTVPQRVSTAPGTAGTPVFGADNRILAMAAGRTVNLAPTDNLAGGFPLPGHLGTVTALRVRADGLLVSRDPRNVRIWDVRGALQTLVDPAAAACARLGHTTPERVWRHYAPNLPYDNACG